MEKVKFLDIHNAWSSLKKKVGFFDDKYYPNLHKILNIEPKKKKGLDFCDCYPMKKQIEDVFNELHRKWKLSKSNIVSTKPDYVEALKETIKNLKKLTVGRNFSKERTQKARDKKRFC